MPGSEAQLVPQLGRGLDQRAFELDGRHRRGVCRRRPKSCLRSAQRGRGRAAQRREPLRRERPAGCGPGDSGQDALARACRRAGPRSRPQVLEGHQQPHAGRDLEVGGVQLRRRPARPSAIQPSIWSSAARNLGERLAHGLVVRVVEPAARRRRSGPRSSTSIRVGSGMPSCASSRKLAWPTCSRFSAHQMIVRGICWNSSSPQRSASSTAARCSRVGREQRRVGLEPVELARDVASSPAPCGRRSSAPARGCPRSRAARISPRLDHRGQVDALVLDALVLEHQPRGHARGATRGCRRA